MANDTWLEIEAAARALSRDNPTNIANRCTASADALIIANRVYRTLYTLYEPRMRFDNGTVSGFAISTDAFDTSLPANWSRILNVIWFDFATYDVAFVTFADGPNHLEILSQDEFNARKARETRTDGDPEYCCLARLAGQAAGSQGRWYMRVGPPPAGQYAFAVHAEIECADMAGAASAPDLPPAGASLLTYLLAWHLALLAGQPALADALLRMAPDQQRAAAYLGVEKEKLQGKPAAGRFGG